MSGGRAVNGVGDAGLRVAAVLRKRRQTAGLTTGDLADRTAALGRPILANAITKIEQGQRRIDVDDLVVLAAAIGVTAAGLLLTTAACMACHGAPPAGFACLSCGTEAVR